MDQFWNVTLELLEGFGHNCTIFGLTLLMAIPLGLIISFGSMSKFLPIKAVVKTFVWIIRGTPLMLQLFVVFYLPSLAWGVSFDRMTAAIIAFVINYAAYFSEIFRGGIEGIPKGQYEAGQVLGYLFGTSHHGTRNAQGGGALHHAGLDLAFVLHRHILPAVQRRTDAALLLH